MTNKRKGFEKNGIKVMSARLIFDFGVSIIYLLTGYPVRTEKY